jgi:hypothetical protein
MSVLLVLLSLSHLFVYVLTKALAERVSIILSPKYEPLLLNFTLGLKKNVKFFSYATPVFDCLSGCRAGSHILKRPLLSYVTSSHVCSITVQRLNVLIATCQNCP